jgi:very-short-patch-repair endonuclease
MANEIARSLRKRMTPQEVKLWVHLRSWRKQGFHFRRQSPRDGYIVDSVCLKHRLIVEVDGGQHNFDVHARRDVGRDNHFASQGFRVLRFGNNEVEGNLEGVLTLIDDALRKPPPGSLRSPTSPARTRFTRVRHYNSDRSRINPTSIGGGIPRSPLDFC